MEARSLSWPTAVAKPVSASRRTHAATEKLLRVSTTGAAVVASAVLPSSWSAEPLLPAVHPAPPRSVRSALPAWSAATVPAPSSAGQNPTPVRPGVPGPGFRIGLLRPSELAVTSRLIAATRAKSIFSTARS